MRKSHRPCGIRHQAQNVVIIRLLGREEKEQQEEEEEGEDEDRRGEESRAGETGRSWLVPELSPSVQENLGKATSLSSAVPLPPAPRSAPAWSGAGTRPEAPSPRRRRGCAVLWNSWWPSPCAPLPPESSEDSEDPLAATSAPRGGQRAPLALGNGDKNLGAV